VQEKQIEQTFELANERYAELGIQVDAAIERLTPIAVSLLCTAGKVMTLPDLKELAVPLVVGPLVVGWPSREIIPAKHELQTNCGPIWKWPTR